MTSDQTIELNKHEILGIVIIYAYHKKTDLSSRKSDQVEPKSKVFFEMKVFQTLKKTITCHCKKIVSTIDELRQLIIRNISIYSCYFYFTGTDHLIVVGLFCLRYSDPNRGIEMIRLNPYKTQPIQWFRLKTMIRPSRPNWPLIRPKSDHGSENCALDPLPTPCYFGLGSHGCALHWVWS